MSSIALWAGPLVPVLLLHVAAGLGGEEPDCNQNGVADAVDLASGTSRDCDLDGVPDECLPLAFDFKLRQTLRAGVRSEVSGLLVAEDLDGDGWVDFATTRDTGHVSILWGEGGRRFSASQDIPVPFGSGPVRAADLDGDGDPDLAILRPTNPYAASDPSEPSEDLGILRNEGRRTFRLEPLEELGEAPFGLIHGDFDGDGAEDLLVAEGGTWDPERRQWAYSSKVLILWNGGSGAFSERSCVEVLAPPVRDFQAADVSGDGVADILAIARNLPVLVLSRGDRTFGEPIVLPEETHFAPWNAAFGDLDQDGDLDLAIGHVDTNRLTILQNVSPGRFEVWDVLREDRDTDQPVFADVDRDGRLDLVACVGHNSVWYARPGGLPSVREHGRYACGGARARAVCDVDRDGWPDIVTHGWRVTSGLWDHISVVYNRRDGRFAAPRVYYLYDRNRFPGGVSRTVAGDFDLEGDVDLASGVATSAGDAAVALSWNDGEGGFEDLSTFVFADTRTHISARMVQAPDLDLDGDPDLVVVGYYGWAAAENRGGRQFVERARLDGLVREGDPVFNGRGLDFCAVWDFDHNGFVDFAFAGDTGRIFVSYNGGGWDLSEWRLVYDWSQQEPEGLHWLWVSGIEAGDWDRDGHGDLAVLQNTRVAPDARWVTRVLLLLGDGDRSFQRGREISLGGAGGDIEAADLNGDGITDLAVGGASEPPELLKGTWVAVFLGDGEGSFREHDRRPVRLFPYVTSGDLDADGDLDLLLTGGASRGTGDSQEFGGPYLEVLLNRGDGTLARHLQFPFDHSPAQVVAEDLNGDGLVDLAVTLRRPAKLAVALNEAPGEVGPPESGPCLELFRRGDGGLWGARRLLEHLFTGHSGSLCPDATDANDDGRLDISDVIYMVNFTFRGGFPPPPPWPECGVDPTPDALGCEEYAECTD